MPVREGLPAAERGRHIPPRDTTTGPPEHPVEHRAVINPPPTTTRDLAGQQRFQTSPFRIGQIVSMQHQEDLPHPALKIRGTRSSGAAPQPDKACRGRPPVSSRLTQGPAVRVADRHHSLRLDMLTKTRSAFMQVRCAAVALWSEHEAAYATWIRPATTKLDSFSPTSSAPASLADPLPSPSRAQRLPMRGHRQLGRSTCTGIAIGLRG